MCVKYAGINLHACHRREAVSRNRNGMVVVAGRPVELCPMRGFRMHTDTPLNRHIVEPPGCALNP